MVGRKIISAESNRRPEKRGKSNDTKRLGSYSISTGVWPLNEQSERPKLMNYATPSSRVDRYPLCFHFLNMVVSLSGDHTMRILDGGTFLDWMEKMDVVPSHVIEGMRANAHPDELDALSLEAQELAAWFKKFLEDFSGKELPPIAAERLAPLNRVLERDTRILQIDSRDGIEDRIAGSGLKSFSRRIWRSPGMLLLPIADDIAHLLCEQNFRNVYV